MPLPDAVAAPRLHHQALPDELYLERGGFVRPSVDSLEAMGHKVSVWGYKTEVNAIARTAAGWVGVADPRRGGGAAGDRKSTRLNSSHGYISYAVFCLK